jgi:hypothetical protein
MRSKNTIRLTVVVAALAVAATLATAPAGAKSFLPVGFGPSWHIGKCLRFDWDDPIVCGLLHRGDRGARGAKGSVGDQGAPGVVGFTGAPGTRGVPGVHGLVGDQGPVGDTGQAGLRGIQGIQGVQGPNGTFVGGGASAHTVTVLGSKIGPIFSASGPMTGIELTPSVAKCPVAGVNTEAYDGGVTISTTGSTDIVTLENSYPGIYVNQTEVDPLPSGSVPGAVSSQPANAYEVQAVVTQLATNDQATIQSYVICGP